mmetsp:Transcript_17134/g.38720  ORF Transcript_17134/g.38720 Transcript_17134/m.38720 type:complete len:454 (-) Transcript_17134:29-1390(-)
MLATKRLAAVQTEQAEVNRACASGAAYLGLSGSDLRSYAATLKEKEQLLLEIASFQAASLKPPPPGPAATFDRCALQSVLQHMLDYEAVPYEGTKALRALASMAYKEPVEVAESRQAMQQLLRLVQLHPEEADLQSAAMKCFCHLAFSAEAVKSLSAPEIIEALVTTRYERSETEAGKLADEAVARIMAAEGEKGGKEAAATRSLFECEAAALGQGRASGLKPMLVRLLDGELVTSSFLADRLVASAPVTEKQEQVAAGWLLLLVELLENRMLAEALVSQGVAMATTALMDLHPRSSVVQSRGVAALSALSACKRAGPLAIAQASGVKRAEAALSNLQEDATLQILCINFLVSVLDWPVPVQKECDMDCARIVAMTKQAMQLHLDVVDLQVAALSGLARLLEVLACTAEVKEGGADGLVKAVMTRHKDHQQVWTWGRIVLDNIGADRHWTYRQ